jgi:polysaccharide export outer membrane protein
MTRFLHYSHVLKSCLCLAGGVTLAACLASGQQGREELTATTNPRPMLPAGVGSGVSAPVDPATFQIGPEDVIEIQVWKEPELSGQVVVRPDGMISVSLAGEIRAAGRTPDQLRETLAKEYGEVLNDPVVMVRMAQIRSSKYYVAGNVRNPGMYPLVVPTRVLEAIVMAGGTTEFADKKKIVVLRKGGERTFFNYNDVAKGKKIEENVMLDNGDFIIVN